jgi:phosphate uptake regulator
METRKIQRVGGGTYTVSIPVDWAENHEIEAGGTAYLYTHRDGSLVVRWDEKENSELAAVEIDLDGADPSVAKRTLTAAYTAGFKRILLRDRAGMAAEQRRAIESRVRGLTGLDVVEEGDHHVAVREMLDASDVSIRQSTIQLQFVVTSMYEAAMDLLTGETTEPDRVIGRRSEVDRIFRLVERHLHRSLSDLAELDQLGMTRSELFEYYTAARQLERIADRAVEIARRERRTEHAVSEELSAELRKLGADTRRGIESAAEAVINGAPRETVHSILDRCEGIVEETRRLDRALARRDPADAYRLSRVLNDVVRIAEHGRNIASVRLRASLRS